MRFVPAGNASDGLALGQRVTAILIIADVVLPDENAFDLLLRIEKRRTDLHRS